MTTVTGPALVTGAAGFVGRHLLDLLHARGVPAVAWRRPGQAIPPHTPDSARWESVELLDRSAVVAAVEHARPGSIFHCAGAAHVGQSWENTRATFEINVMGTHAVLEADRLLGLRARILVPGSATVYRASAGVLTEASPVAPNSPYGISKLAQEQLALAAAGEGQHVLVTRSFNHIGPRQDPAFAVSSFARQIAGIERAGGDGRIRVGNLDARRDLTDVRDTVRAYVALVERGTPGVLYNVCSGRALAMREVLDLLIARARCAVTVEPDPSLYRPTDTPVTLGSHSRITTDTGWTPEIPLGATLDALLAYWRAETTPS